MKIKKLKIKWLGKTQQEANLLCGENWRMIVKDNLTKSERNLLISKIKSIEKNHKYSLNLQGVGYSIKKDESNNRIILNIGYTNKIMKDIPNDINIEIKGSEGNVTMTGSSRNLDKLSQWMSSIRELKPAYKDKYKGKGFRLERIME